MERPGFYHFGIMKLLGGDPAGALALVKNEPDSQLEAVAIRAMANFSLGNLDAAESARRILLENDKYVGGPLKAHVSAWMNMDDLAFEELNKLPTGSGMWSVFFPILRKLHDDPRWDEWRTSVGMSKEFLDSIEFDPQLPE